jgi:hypothetical protein
MTLPLRQFRALAYLADCSPAGTGAVAGALHMDRDKVKAALAALVAKNLASADLTAYPTSFTITDAGRERLAAMAESGES